MWSRIVLCLVLLGVPSAGWAQTNFESKTDVTVTSSATLVLAGNSFRYALNCTNTSASVNVRWGDSTVTASKGQQFRAGTSIEINSRAPVYMISEGANVTVSCTEETK